MGILYKDVWFCFAFFQAHESHCSFVGVKCTNIGGIVKLFPWKKIWIISCNKECPKRNVECYYCKIFFVWCSKKVIMQGLSIICFVLFTCFFQWTILCGTIWVQNVPWYLPNGPSRITGNTRLFLYVHLVRGRNDDQP